MAELVKGKAALKTKAKTKVEVKVESKATPEPSKDAPSTGVVIRNTSALERSVAINPRLAQAANFVELMKTTEAPILEEDQVVLIPTAVGSYVRYTHDEVKSDARRGYREVFKDLAMAGMAERIDTMRKAAADKADVDLEDGIPE
jgi:hypothetical protein